MKEPRRDQVEIGKRLREARLAAGLTQKDVETATETPHSVLSEMENGKRSINEARALAFATAIPNLDPDDLRSVASPSLLASVRELRDLVLRLS